MKILFIDREVSMSGASVITVNAAEALAKRGHQVKILVMFSTAGHPKTSNVSVTTFPITIANLLIKNRLMLTTIGSIMLFFMCLKEASWADVLIPVCYPTHWLAVVAGKIWRRRIVWSCYEPWIEFKPADIRHVGYLTWLASLIARSPIDNLMVQKIDSIFVLDRKNQKRVRQLYNRDALIIRPGVDWQFFSRGKISAGRKLFQINDRFIITCAAALTPMKNQIVLIEALAKIKKTAPKIVLFLAGDGPMRDFLKKRVKDLGIITNIRFLGQVEPSELRHLYAVSGLLVFPAIRQTWGLTPFEAACVGTPSVVSSDCGAAEVIGEQGIGLVVEPRAKKFAEAILRLYRNPALRKKLGQQAKRYVRENLTWEFYAQEIERLLKK